MNLSLTRKKIIAGIIFLILIIAVPITLLQVQRNQESRSRASAPPVTLILTPLTETKMVGSEFDVQLSINTSTNDISGIEIELTYNKDILELISYTPTAEIPKIKQTIDSSTGTFYYLGAKLSSDPTTGSNVTLGTFKLRGKTSGVATLGFQDIKISASGVREYLPIDTENTKNGTYSIIFGDPLLTPTQTPATPTPTGGVGEQDPTATPQPTTPPTSTPTSIPTATPTSKPAATLAPTATITPGDTTLTVSTLIPGIGENVQLGQNNQPQNPQRTAIVEIYNTSNQLISTISGMLTYTSNTSSFNGNLSLGSTFATGEYTAKIRINNSLMKRIPGIIAITTKATNTSLITPLVTGDLNQDNELNLTDYNGILNCYGSKTCSTKSLADLNDDGKVDEIDLNILYSGFAKRNGD